MVDKDRQERILDLRLWWQNLAKPFRFWRGIWRKNSVDVWLDFFSQPDKSLHTFIKSVFSVPIVSIGLWLLLGLGEMIPWAIGGALTGFASMVWFAVVLAYKIWAEPSMIVGETYSKIEEPKGRIEKIASVASIVIILIFGLAVSFGVGYSVYSGGYKFLVTETPYPTYTPYSTYTPNPTYTALPTYTFSAGVLTPTPVPYCPPAEPPCYYEILVADGGRTWTGVSIKLYDGSPVYSPVLINYNRNQQGFIRPFNPGDEIYAPARDESQRIEMPLPVCIGDTSNFPCYIIVDREDISFEDIANTYYGDISFAERIQLNNYVYDKLTNDYSNPQSPIDARIIVLPRFIQ